MKSLTKKQQALVDQFVTTKTQAKVRRRKRNPDGTFSFFTIVRETSPIDFPVSDEEFALKIHEEKPDAPLSPIYVNLRNLPPNLITGVAQVLSEIPFTQKADFCTAIPKTALAFAKEYSKFTRIPFVDLFDKVDGDTTRAIIAKTDAPKGKGKKIIVIDDVIAHGNSKVEALQEAGKLGYTVSAIVVLIDRGQGGVKKMQKAGYETLAAMDLPSILDYLHKSKQISQQRYTQITHYLTRK